jgi:hypothetical protein
MSKEMHPTHKLLEYISVFLDKSLSPQVQQTIKINILNEIVAYHKQVITDWCAQNYICEFCYEQKDRMTSDLHKCED